MGMILLKWSVDCKEGVVDRFALTAAALEVRHRKTTIIPGHLNHFPQLVSHAHMLTSPPDITNLSQSLGVMANVSQEIKQDSQAASRV